MCDLAEVMPIAYGVDAEDDFCCFECEDGVRYVTTLINGTNVTVAVPHATWTATVSVDSEGGSGEEGDNAAVGDDVEEGMADNETVVMLAAARDSQLGGVAASNQVAAPRQSTRAGAAAVAGGLLSSALLRTRGWRRAAASGRRSFAVIDAEYAAAVL